MEIIRSRQSPEQEREVYLVPAEVVRKLLTTAQSGYSTNSDREARQRLHEILVMLNRLLVEL